MTTPSSSSRIRSRLSRSRTVPTSVPKGGARGQRAHRWRSPTRCAAIGRERPPACPPARHGWPSQKLAPEGLRNPAGSLVIVAAHRALSARPIPWRGCHRLRPGVCYHGPRMTWMSRSRIFLRSVLRLRPSMSAALSWLPRVAARGSATISGRSTSRSTRS